MDDRDWRPGWPESEPGWSAWVLVLGICFLGSVGGTADTICERWVDQQQTTPATHSHAMEAHGVPRSWRWTAVRRLHLEREPACAVCGLKADLQVHHIRAFAWPGGESLELDDGTNGFDGNLITLCSGPGSHNCHLLWGHLLNYQSENLTVREDAKWFREKIKNRPYKKKEQSDD